jgi:hypothetical protein
MQIRHCQKGRGLRGRREGRTWVGECAPAQAAAENTARREWQGEKTSCNKYFMPFIRFIFKIIFQGCKKRLHLLLRLAKARKAFATQKGFSAVAAEITDAAKSEGGRGKL